ALGFSLADGGQGVDLSVAVPRVVSGATLAVLRCAVGDRREERVLRELSSRRARPRIGGVVDARLDLARLGDGKAGDQGGDPRHVRRGHGGSLLIAVERRSLEDSARWGAVSHEGARPRRKHAAKWV